MSNEVISEPIKSCLWVDTISFNVPIQAIKSPAVIGSQRDISIGYLKDEFEIYVVKATDAIVKTAIYRTRTNLNEELDDGYILRFYFTLTGFDEEPQVAYMKHNDQKVSATFIITERILAKANNTHHVFDLFVIVQMLEFRSLSENHVSKIRIDGYMSVVKFRLNSKAIEDLSFTLKSPGLEDTFTGRLPLSYLRGVMVLVAMIIRNNEGIADYLRERYSNEESDMLDELQKILNYFATGNEERLIDNESAVELYLLAHKLGLDCLKVISSDYLLSILEEDYIVLEILEASLMVQDECLFDKAVVCFLNRFNEIITSDRFEYYSDNKGLVTRLIMHSARVWVSHNGRQDFEFAELKSNYIKRTASFSKEIFGYLRAKDACLPVPAIDFEIILNYILNGELSSITNKDLIRIYLLSHRMGLCFLANLSRDCILWRCGDINLLVGGTQAAESVIDELFLDKVARTFIRSKEVISNCETWRKMIEDSRIKCKFILLSFRMVILKRRSLNVATLEEASASNFFEYL